MKDRNTEAVMGEVALNLTRKGSQICRLFHGRGQGFPGLEWLNIDYYPPVLILQVYKPEMGNWINSLSKALGELILAAPGYPSVKLVLKQNRHHPQSHWEILEGNGPAEGIAWEDGLQFKLKFMENQNVGFFPDMRQGRRLIREIGGGKRVLNLFAYTCSLSVAALAGGASRVVNLDLSKTALRTGRQNHILNQLDPRNAVFLPFDVMKSFGRMKREGPFDLVIVDPPSYQKPSFIAERDYPKLARRIPEIMTESGDLIACLNAPHLTSDFLQDLFEPGLHLCRKLTSPEEFREADPERGLKIAQFRRNPGK